MTRALTSTVALLFVAVLVAPQARAEHRYSPLEEVRAIAHELERATGDLYKAAKYARHHYDRRERHALDDLYRLKDRARHFHREVERRWRDPYHTEADFLELRRAVDHVMRGRRDLHPYPAVDRRLARVHELMARLEAYYAEYTGWGRHRRYDDRRHGHLRYERPRVWFEWGWWR